LIAWSFQPRKPRNKEYEEKEKKEKVFYVQNHHRRLVFQRTMMMVCGHKDMAHFCRSLIVLEHPVFERREFGREK